MKVIKRGDKDLGRFPIGATVTCGQFTEDEGCGTVYQIETRTDWYNKRIHIPYNPYGQTYYDAPYANCPNCGRANLVSKAGQE